MLGIVFALPVLLIAASAMAQSQAQSPKVEEPPPVSSGSSVPPRDAVHVAQAPVAVTSAPLADDGRRQEDARRRAFLMLLLNSGGHVQPFGGMSH